MKAGVGTREGGGTMRYYKLSQELSEGGEPRVADFGGLLAAIAQWHEYTGVYGQSFSVETVYMEPEEFAALSSASEPP